MVRIGFTIIGGRAWAGGYNYLINLLTVLASFCSGKVQPVLFLGNDLDLELLQPLLAIEGVEVIYSDFFNESRGSWSLIRSLIFGSDFRIKRLLMKHSIDVVFENARFFGFRIGIPVIAWIPDLQHRDMPTLFSSFSWWKRELGFRLQIAAGRHIMLSSNDASKACHRYYPSTVGRTHVVRFAVMPRSCPSLADIDHVRILYQLPSHYFYLPNQFYKHKNHQLVLNALNLLQVDAPGIIVVASGRQPDPSASEYFRRFLAYRESAGLSDSFRLLGMIPYEHIAPLMLGSLAVLNPSLYEGWSTTVEEARVFSVRLLLSDLPVNQEQAAGIARFFDRSSEHSLASLMLEVWNQSASGQTSSTHPSSPTFGAVRQFASDFAGLAEFAASSS